MNNLTSTINITIPIDIKDEATELFNSLGLNLNTAINIFLKRSIYETWCEPQIGDINKKEPNRKIKGEL